MTPDPERALEHQRAIARGEHPLVIRALSNPVCEACNKEMHRTRCDDLWHWRRYECDCGAWVEMET